MPPVDAIFMASSMCKGMTTKKVWSYTLVELNGTTKATVQPVWEYPDDFCEMQTKEFIWGRPEEIAAFQAIGDMVRLPRFDAIETTLCALALAHRARCACAILRRETADTNRVGRPDLRGAPEPSRDSITEIAWYNFSTRNCTCLRSSRS
jgi:hypothetical protein